MCIYSSAKLKSRKNRENPVLATAINSHCVKYFASRQKYLPGLRKPRQEVLPEVEDCGMCELAGAFVSFKPFTPSTVRCGLKLP